LTWGPMPVLREKGVKRKTRKRERSERIYCARRLLALFKSEGTERGRGKGSIQLVGADVVMARAQKRIAFRVKFSFGRKDLILKRRGSHRLREKSGKRSI